MAVDLDRLWSAPVVEPVQPRLLDAMTGLDEKLLRLYRQAPSRWLGGRLRPEVTRMLNGGESGSALHQMTRMAGVALWEREHGQIADSIGV